MKKVLSILFLFFALCLPVFSADSIFVPDITSVEVKKALIGEMLSKGWFLKNETNYSLDFYKTENEQTYDGPLLTIENVQFIFIENKGVKLSFNFERIYNPNTTEQKREDFWSKTNINDILKELFIGSYSYNIKYKIKKDYVLITDNNKTVYEG